MFEEEHLSIARISTLLLILLTISCATSNDSTKVGQSNCHVKRAAIDLGSGSTKLVVGLVDTCRAMVEGILFEAQRAVPLKDQLQSSKDNKFNEEMQNRLRDVFDEFKYLAKNEGAEDIRAVATSAFRTSANGDDVADQLKEQTGVDLEIISQEDEAKFAYSAALSKLKSMNVSQNPPIAIWDIGGGSMQITKPIDKKGEQTQVALLKVASVTFKNLVLKEFYPKGTKTPNPLKEERALKAMDLARVTAKEQLSDFGNLKDYQVYGVGGVHYFSIGGQFKKANRVYNQSTLLAKLLERAKLTDKEIDSKYASTDVTNMALVLGFMQTLKVDEVKPIKVNMAHGLLINPTFWE
ncbi:hypothetical protein C0Z22_05990 [Halobacteriovorax sp. DA5]|nr:hypothetical protein C0Z22_05990 [Halobacteriovorax sp. DA5]